jgi:hypothetical protein
VLYKVLKREDGDSSNKSSYKSSRKVVLKALAIKIKV